MADSPAFEIVCQALEASTSLDRLESRGTVRISLKQAGLEASRVTIEQMRVVVSQVLTGELRTRGIDDVDGIVESLLRALDDAIAKGAGESTAESQFDSPETVFARLGGA